VSGARARALLTCLLLLGATPRSALPAESADPFVSPDKPPRPEYLPPRPTEEFRLPPVTPRVPAAPALASEPRRFEAIAFKGNTAVPTRELEAIAQPYLRRPVGIVEVEELRQKLTRHYVDRGYINSGALLGVDPARADVLVCEIVEGRLAAVRLSGLGRLSESYVANRLARDRDRPLNVDVLRERFQVLLNDPLISRMNARLMPGSRPGEAILDVEVVRARPYQLTLFADNYRPPSIGSEAIGLSGWVRNLTGQGDVIEASVQDSARWDSGLRGSVGLRMPVGPYGTGVSALYERGRSSVVEEPLTLLGIRSRLETRDAGVNQTFIETLRDKLTVGANYVERENRTWLLGIPFSFVPGEPDGFTRTTGWKLWQEYSHRSETQVFALRSTFSTVRNNLQDVADLPPSVQPDHKYRFWLGQAQFARQVMDNGTQVILRATVQRTRDTLLTLDGMPIGGVNTVRGYRENQLIRDNAQVANVEVEYPLLVRQVQLTLTPFYDYGRGRNNGFPSVTLSSIGLAAKARWRGFTAYVAAAKRLTHPEFVDSLHGNLQDKGIHFYLSYDFF